MKHILKCTEKNHQKISKLPKIYLIEFYGGRYALCAFPWTKKMIQGEGSVPEPLVYSYKLTADAYVLERISRASSGVYVGYAEDEEEGQELVKKLNKEHEEEEIERDCSKLGYVRDRGLYGFNNSTWQDLSLNTAVFLKDMLSIFKEKKDTIPSPLYEKYKEEGEKAAADKWNKTLDTMIAGFEAYVDTYGFRSFDYFQMSGKEQVAAKTKFKKGLRLFCEYFEYLSM